MLSILIPVFNENIIALADDLKRVMIEENAKMEVIFSDDASYNKECQKLNLEHIKGWPNFQYVIQEKNLGFCGNRNALGRIAQFKNLLFIDADTKIENDHFLTDWIQNLSVHNVICGGNIFPENTPDGTDLFLKWKHSKKREEADAYTRNKHPWRRFSASNFVIPKRLFQKHPFESSGRKYGYNDTVYGYRLKKAGIGVGHIDNPVLNEGIFGNEKFISRSKEAISNLLEFELHFSQDPDFKNHIKVLGLYYKLEKLGIIKLVYLVLKYFEKSLLSNLKSKKPSLRNLDLMKILWLIEIKKVGQIR